MVTQTKQAGLDNFDQFLNAADGAALVALVRQHDLNAILEAISAEQVAQVVEKFGEDAAFQRFVQEINGEPVAAVSPGLEDEPEVSFERLLGYGNGAELVTFLRSVDLSLVTGALTQEEVDAVVNKFAADASFAAFLMELGVTPPAPVKAVQPLPTGEALTQLIDYAQTNGQGELSYNSSGQLVNRYGEVMVLDSSGNLAPAPLSFAPGEQGRTLFELLVGMASGRELVAHLKSLELQRVVSVLTPERVDAVVNKFAADASFAAFLREIGVTPPEPVKAPKPLPTGEALAQLIDYAQDNGQGVLNYNSTGQLVNRFGEEMVLDSGGNLAPAPRDIPLGMMRDASGQFVPDPAFVWPETPADVPGSVSGPVAQNPVSQPLPDGSSLEALIAYAQAHGQGVLSYNSAGQLINRFGEVMVLDSSGNLAPAPMAPPVVLMGVPEPMNFSVAG